MKVFMLAASLLASALAAEAQAATYAYVSLAGEGKIAIYRVDEKTGALTHTGEVAVKGAPGSLTTDAARRHLYVAVRESMMLASFRIDPATGALTPISIIPVDANPSFVGLDRTEKYLLSAYYLPGKVMVHAVGKEGTLDPTPRVDRTTARNAHCAIPDPSNHFVFVPHVGPNSVFQFAFDPTSGQLTPNAVPTVSGPEGAGPRHLRFHPSGKWVYTSNESGSSVSVYHFDAQRGTLSLVQTLSTLPAGFTGENTTAEVKLHPSGKFLYVSNRGHDSLALFSIDAATGRLTAHGQTPTEHTPRSFDFDPTGRYLYAAGEGGTRLAAYRIDPASGALTRIETYEVGKAPFWVLTVFVP
jgi:6-phosphogluconolactonase